MNNITQNHEVEDAIEVNTEDQSVDNDTVEGNSEDQTQVTVIPVRREEGAVPNISNMTEMQVGILINVMEKLYGESGAMLANGMIQNQFDSIYIPSQSELIQILNDGADHKYLAINNRIVISITEMAAAEEQQSAHDEDEEMSESV